MQLDAVLPGLVHRHAWLLSEVVCQRYRSWGAEENQNARNCLSDCRTLRVASLCHRVSLHRFVPYSPFALLTRVGVRMRFAWSSRGVYRRRLPFLRFFALLSYSFFSSEASAALEGQSPSAGPREGERSSSLGQPFAEDQKEERDSFFSAAAVGPPPALEGVSYFSHEGFLRASLPFRHSRQMVTVINAAVNATKGGGGGGAPGSDAKKRKT